MSIGKIDVTAALANVEKILREDKTSSPQVRAMMELLVLIINLLLGKLVADSHRAALRLGFPLDAVERWFPSLYPATPS